MERWEKLKSELLKWVRDADGEEEIVLGIVLAKMSRIEEQNPTLVESIEFEK